MSSNDQQYPYGPAPDQGYGHGYDGPSGGQQPQQPPHAARPQDPYAYGDGSTGAQPYPPQAHGGRPYGDQPHAGQPYGSPSYGDQPYGGQVYGGGAHAPQPDGGQTPQPHGGQSYDDRPYGGQSYGGQLHGGVAQPHPRLQPQSQPQLPPQANHQPQANESYGGRPYGDQSHGAPVPGHGAAPYDQGQVPGTHVGAAWPTGAGHTPGPAAGHTQEPVPFAAPAPGPQDPHVPYDPAVTQTWEGQTWDTQYQPAIRPTGSTGPFAPEGPSSSTGPTGSAGHSGTTGPAGPTSPNGPAQPETSARESVPSAAETAYLPPYSAYSAGPQGATGSHPLPPEAPVAPAPVSGAAHGDGPAATGSAATTTSGLDTSGYGTPSTLGNSRVTDAQRARAEGRSPIIPPGIQPAGLTAVLGLLLALGAAIGSYALLVPLVLLQAVTAAGWFRLNGMWPARQGIALAFAGGIVADVALLAAGRENAPAAVLGTLGVWVLLTVVLQLRSHADADERMYGLMATTASAALTVLAAGHLAAVPDAVTAGTVAVAAAVLVRALPLPGPASVAVALLAGAGAGAAAGALAGPGGTHGALLGLAAGGCALIGLRAASYDYPSRFVHMTAGVALPLTAAAPAVYLIGRMLA